MVPVELDGFNVCCFSVDNAGAVGDEVATGFDSSVFEFFFLWTDGADNAWEGDSSG